MKVVLVHAGLPERGGVTVDVRNLERGLREHEVEVTAVGRLDELRLVLRGARPLVHVFGCLPSVTIFGALALARAHRLPLVWTPIFHPSRPRTWRGYGALRTMEVFDRLAPHAARLADAVIGATEAETAFFRSLGARSELIPPGVEDLGPDEAPPPEFLTRLGLEAGCVLVTVARDNSRKALPFGLRAFHQLRVRRPDAQLLLVGPPAGFAAGEAGVACPGWLDPPEVELALRAGTALFVPSLYEGLPRAVIEAWRVGTPAVVTERVALAPLVADGRGVVVPYGDVTATAAVLEALLADPGRAASMGAAGRTLVAEQFLLPALVARTIDLYAEVAEARPG